MRFWFLLLLSLVGFQAQGAPLKLMVLGDSLSAAYGIPRESGWVALLGQRAEQRGLPLQIRNASISGETSYGALTRLPRLLEEFSPDLLIVELGGNDGLRGLNLRQTRDNLARIIELAREGGAGVLLLGMRLPPNFGPQFEQKFQQIFSELAAEYGLPFHPFFLDGVAQKREWMQGDGIHPNAQGQPRMLDNVWPLLEPMLLEASAQ